MTSWMKFRCPQCDTEVELMAEEDDRPPCSNCRTFMEIVNDSMQKKSAYRGMTGVDGGNPFYNKTHGA